jgi:glycosyltransferase involved in cell wall biosynthesis
MTDVSVVIPTRNRWPTVRRTIEATLAQAAVEIEIIVLDDGSTDETARELPRLADGRIRFARHATPLGPARARNTAIEHATAPWIAFLDDDDRWAPGKLRAQLDAAGEADFVYASAIAVDPRGAIVDTFPAPPAEGLLRQLLVRSAVPAGASNVLARTAVIRALGGFDARFHHLDDWDLWIRLATAHVGSSVPEVLVAHVHHQGNRIVTDRAPGALAELDLLVARHTDLCRREGLWPDRAEHARWVATGHRRAKRRGAAAMSYLRAGLASHDPADAARAVGAIAGVWRGRTGRPLSPAPAWALP